MLLRIYSMESQTSSSLSSCREKLNYRGATACKSIGFLQCASHCFPIYNVFIEWWLSCHVRKILFYLLSSSKMSVTNSLPNTMLSNITGIANAIHEAKVNPETEKKYYFFLLTKQIILIFSFQFKQGIRRFAFILSC